MSQPSARSSEATELVEAGLAGVDDPVGPKLGSPRDATGPTPPGLEPGGGSVVDEPVPASRGGGRHSGLIRYIIRRLIIAVILVFGLTLVTFCLTNLVPGDPVAAALGQRAADNPATVAQFKAEYGLDKPLPEQYLTYLVKLLHGDLGQSAQTHRAITQDLAQAVPATAEIALGAIVASAIIGICFGAWSAYKRGKITDQVLRFISLIGLSVPTFWMAIVCFYVFYYRLGWAPGSGRLSPEDSPPTHITGLYTVDALLTGNMHAFVDASAHLMLPTLVLTLYTIGLLTRYSRTSFLEVLDTDYVRAAKAKGLPGHTVFFHYVLRAASIPILTVIGLAFGSLLSGTVLVENIFGWPGIGAYAFQAASKLDLLGVMGVGLFVGLVYLTINLIIDLLYGFLDPRVRVGS